MTTGEAWESAIFQGSNSLGAGQGYHFRFPLCSLLLVWLGQTNDQEDPGTSLIPSFIHSFMDICPKRGLTMALGRGGRTTHTVDAPHREPGAEEGS